MKEPPKPPKPPNDKEQLGLFEIPTDRPSVPLDTSEAASESMRSEAQGLRERVLVAIWEHRGLTQDEYEHLSGMRLNTLHPRFWELEKRRLIVKSDDLRPTRANRQAHVYRTTAQGDKVAAWLAARQEQ